MPSAPEAINGHLLARSRMTRVIPDCGDGATADVRPAKGVKRAAMAGRCASDEAVTTTCIRARSP